MTDITPAPASITSTLLSYLPDVRNWSWTQWTKVAAAIGVAMLAYQVYAATESITAWFKPAPEPVKVEYVPAASFADLKGSVEEIKGAIGQGAADVKALNARVQALEAASVSPKKSKK